MSNNLNSFLFTTPEMTKVFSAQQRLRAMMRFEWALTCALEIKGLAKSGSAAVLESLMDTSFVDIELLEQEARAVGNIAIPFVKQLTAAVGSEKQEAACAIHLGATSQDVLDTALILQIRDGEEILRTALRKLEAALLKQVKLHRDTMMLGRTWLQPGPPTTLGLKLAGTVAALRRHRERIRASMDRALVLQFGGGVGTLAPLGQAGIEVSAQLASVLELREAELPWHAQRDNLVEIVQVLANLTGSLAKFARDVALLMQAEVGEVSEGRSESAGGSSTMPHKHNPVACAAVIAAYERMPGLAATMLLALPQEHERGLGLWQAEWDTVPEAFRLTASALEYAIEIADGMLVNKPRMQENFDALLGTTMAEAVSAALARKIGRLQAHDLLRQATERANQDKQHLKAVLKRMPEVHAELGEEEIDQLMEPRTYLGSAQQFIDRVLGETDAGD